MVVTLEVADDWFDGLPTPYVFSLQPAHPLFGLAAVPLVHLRCFSTEAQVILTHQRRFFPLPCIRRVACSAADSRCARHTGCRETSMQPIKSACSMLASPTLTPDSQSRLTQLTQPATGELLEPVSFWLSSTRGRPQQALSLNRYHVGTRWNTLDHIGLQSEKKTEM